MIAAIRAINPPKIRKACSTKKSEMPITIRVGPGKSAPKLLNTYLKDGITQIISTATTTTATMMMAAG